MRNLVKAVSVAAIAFAVIPAAGCRAVKAPATPYETWTPADDGKKSEAPDPVWASIRKQEFDASEPLTLVDVIDIALRNNPSTREAWENARAAQARMKQAGSQYYPQVTAAGGATRQKEVSDDVMADIDNLAYGPNAKITWLLLDVGGRRAAVNEAAQTLLAQNFRFNLAIQDLLLAAEKAYYGLYSAQAGVMAAESDVNDSKKVLDAAQQRLDAGLAVKLDVLQAQSNYENALFALEEAKGQVKTGKANLAQVLALPADTAFDIADPSREIPADLGGEDVSRLIEEALDSRPDIAASRASLKAKKYAAIKANSALWPSLTASGSAAKNWSQVYDDDAVNANDYEYLGYVGVEWSVFDGFYNLNIKRAALADAEAARENLRNAELAASADVWIKYYAFRTDVQKLKYGEAYLASAGASYALAQEGYDAGLKSILDLLHAQSELSAARSKLIQSRKDLFVALADLAHATGSLRHSKEAGPGGNKEDEN